jgi:hypothetical protein
MCSIGQILRNSGRIIAGMLSKVTKLASIAALLSSFLWSFLARGQVWSVQVGGYLELLVLVVSITALMVVAETLLAQKYLWAIGFLAIAVLFNPVVPIRVSRPTFLLLDSFCIIGFVLAITVLKIDLDEDLLLRTSGRY